MTADFWATLSNPMVLRALVVALVIALAAAPLGCLMVWNRMAYYGDTLAHAGFLGAAIALLWQKNLLYGVLAVAVTSALILARYQHQNRFSSDSLLGVIAHGSLALALILTALPNAPRIDIMAVLQGEILLIPALEAMILIASCLLILLLCRWFWKPLVALSISRDIALAEGIAKPAHNLLMILMMAVFVALCIQWVGVLMVAAILIIPAAAANLIAGSVRSQPLWTMLSGCLAVLCGMAAAIVYDLPASPAIIVTSTLIYLVHFIIRKSR